MAPAYTSDPFRYLRNRALGRMNAGGGQDRLRPDLAILQSKGQPFFLHDFSRTDLTFQDVNGIAAADDAAEAVALAVSMDSIGGKTLTAARAQGVKDDFSYANTAALQAVWSAQAGVTASLDNGRILIANDTDGGFVVRTFTLAAGTWLFGIDLQGGTGTCDCVLATTSGGSDVLSSLGGSTGAGSGIVRRGGVFTWTGGTLYCRVRTGPPAGAGATSWAGNITFVPGYHAIQSGSTGARPARQAGGVLRFDGSDDNLLSALAPGAAGTLIVAFKQSSLFAGLLMGARESTSTRVAIGVNGAGQLLGHVGSQTGSTIVGGSDLVGQRAVGALTYDGATVNLYANGVNIYSGAQVGTPTTLRPFRIGSGTVSDGTAESWIAADFYQAAAIQAALTPAEIDSILNFWSTL